MFSPGQKLRPAPQPPDVSSGTNVSAGRGLGTLTLAQTVMCVKLDPHMIRKLTQLYQFVCATFFFEMLNFIFKLNILLDI